MTVNLSVDDRLALHRALVAHRHAVALEYAADALEGSPLLDAPHHPAICKALDAVIDGRITRLIINIPPGYGKTLSAVWSFIARGLAINPGSRYIHTSYSADLALDNSTKVRDVLASAIWQTLCPIALRADVAAKGLWRTDEGGGIRAAQAGGAITGFRAGRLGVEGYSGAMVIDDPLKPDDARSRKRVSDQNKRYNTTIASRLAHEAVPIIVIMQRLCAFAADANADPADAGDMCEFLLRGGSGEVWDHLELPAVIDNARPYPAEWTHGRPIAHGLPDGPLWPEKLDEISCARLKRANPYVWSAQYEQRPKPRSGDPMIHGEWFGRYVTVPKLRTVELFADTANKTAERSDYSVMLVAGTDGTDLYILDVLRGKWTAPDLIKQARTFWDQWRAKGATRFNVEDAASGTGLIQTLAEEIGYSVKGVTRTKDKFTRVNGVLERISSGRVLIPVSAPWVSEFVAECEEFTDDNTHAHDDQVDTLVDAISMLLGSSSYSLEALI